MTTQILSGLLRRRLAIIGDHAWRDRDPSAHLEALARVSGEITAWTAAHGTSIDARLRHYLGNASFQKALEHLESMELPGEGAGS
jgi:hypothetical protein